MAKIAFIGLGNMGAPMSENLLKAGHDLSVFDISTEAMNRLAGKGAKVAKTTADVVAGVDFVFSMLPTDREVKDVYLGSGQVLNHARQGTLLIDCSTISSATAVALSKAARDKALEMIDAPVSGGTTGASNATLTFIVGGDATSLDKVRPILSNMGKNVFHAGGNGAGLAVKICNNMLLGILMIGTAEALNLGIANGLDPKLLSDTISKSSGRNFALEAVNPWPGVMENAPSSNDYQGGFSVDLMLKDLGLAVEYAVSSKVSTPLGALARSLFDIHSKKGSGGLDFSSIVKLLRPS